MADADPPTTPPKGNKKAIKAGCDVLYESIAHSLVKRNIVNMREAIAEEYCGICNGPCLRRPRHTDAPGVW
jgi:hypothetical protein